MAAQDGNGPRICGRCFAEAGETTPYCPECGAPLTEDAEGSDVAIYPELARANLLRMRGQYKPAEDVCLGILRRFPNNASANTLLGDICAERGDLDQAAQWFELALDIAADSEAVHSKLEAVKQRLSDREAAATAKQIGLPTTRPRTTLYALVTILAILAVGVTAFLIGQRAQPAQAVMSAPIDVTPPREPIPTPPVDPSRTPESEAPRTPGPWHDSALTAELRARLAEGGRVLDVWKDPRTQAVMLTCSTDDTESARETAARLAVSAMEHFPTAGVLTVRLVRRGAIAYVADVPRDRVVAISSDAWREENAGSPGAWIDAVLTNEWSVDRPTEATIGGEHP